MTKRVNGLCVKGFLLKEKAQKILLDSLKSKKGATYVEIAIAIIIALGVGLLLYMGIHAMFKDNVLPTVNKKVTDMFNYKG